MEIKFRILNSNLYLCILFVASMLSFIGCADVPQSGRANSEEARLEGARLTTAEAIRIAKESAEKQGIRLTDFKEPEAHYEFTIKDKTWSVFFDGRIPRLGNHFTIYVSDRTKETQFVPGR
jgi:hypothetical protein